MRIQWPNQKYFLAKAKGHTSGPGGQTLHEVNHERLVLAKDRSEAEEKAYSYYRNKAHPLGKAYHVHIEASEIELIGESK